MKELDQHSRACAAKHDVRRLQILLAAHIIVLGSRYYSESDQG